MRVIRYGFPVYLFSIFEGAKDMYDLIIIGGGPGGYVAAERAGSAGLRVALFEKELLGGVCLNVGCIPSKALLNSAKLYRHAVDSKAFGITAESVSFNQATVIRRKKKVVRKLVAGVKMQMDEAGVEIISASATILPKENELFRVEADDTIYEGKHLIIATGSESVILPIPGIRESLGTTVVTNREILDLTEIPETLVVIGGGVIGLEMACYYQTVGSNVIVIEMLDHIAGNIDPEIGKRLQQVYEKLGMVFHLSSCVTRVDGGAVTFVKDGEEQIASGDLVLMSCGRRPVSSGFGLENLSVQTQRGAIVVNDHMQTSCPGVYAIGDVVGGYMLAHAASREGEVAVNHILGIEDQMSNRAMPSVIYTDPEVASVGQTKQELEAAGCTFIEVELPMGWSGRYQAETERGTGLCRLLLDSETKELLGCHLFTPYASEMILAFVIMLEQRMTLDEMKRTIFPHPSVGEIVREALFKVK